jgi:hypothetical protein
MAETICGKRGSAGSSAKGLRPPGRHQTCSLLDIWFSVLSVSLDYLCA